MSATVRGSVTRQPSAGTGEVLELSAPFDAVAGRQHHLARQAPLAASATNLPWSRPRMLVRTLTCRRFSRRVMMLAPSRSRSRRVGTAARARRRARRRAGCGCRRERPGTRRVPHGDVEAPVALEHYTHGLAADGQFDDLLHVRHVQSVTGDRRPVHADLELGLVGILLDGGVGRARDASDDRQRAVGQAAQFVEVGTGEDHREVGRRSGHGLGDHVDDRLREAEDDAGDVRTKRRGELLDEVGLRAPRVQLSYGWSATRNSVRFGPNGSVFESCRPVCELTRRTSGARRISSRMLDAISADFSMATPGASVARIQMTPSSSCGRNSRPTREPRPSAPRPPARSTRRPARCVPARCAGRVRNGEPAMPGTGSPGAARCDCTGRWPEPARTSSSAGATRPARSRR